MASRLTLDCPSSHDIYFKLKGEAFSRPISASVILKRSTDTELAGAERVRIPVVRILSSKTSLDLRQPQPAFPKAILSPAVVQTSTRTR